MKTYRNATNQARTLVDPTDTTSAPIDVGPHGHVEVSPSLAALLDDQPDIWTHVPKPTKPKSEPDSADTKES